MFENVLENISVQSPIVHCITNFVTVNDCANIILACGASPTMAYHPDEVEEITGGSSSLVLNMGTVSDTEAMLLAAKKSNELHHPVVLDPVGAGASKLRMKVFEKLSEQVHLDVIRGNVSEIKHIATGYSESKGVDAGAADRITEANVKGIARMASELSCKLKNIVVVSGPIDIVTDGVATYLVRNGHPIMSQITGTGCMSTALMGAFCGANQEKILEAVLLAVIAMGVGGERAYEKTRAENGGTMTFRMHLVDYISLMTADMLLEGMRIEQL